MKIIFLKLFATWAFVFSVHHSFAQLPDTLSLPKKLLMTPKRYQFPAAMVVAGFLLSDQGKNSLKNQLKVERNEHMPSFRTHIDDYLQFSPIAVSYMLDAAGIPSRTDWRNRTAILIKGEMIMMAATASGKHFFHQIRPDGTDYASLPSGHTAQAFAAATFLSEEYKERFRWMPYAAYSVAASVGALRIANNKHYISDVLAGAGIGILSMKLSYWTHQYKWHPHHKSKPVIL